MPTPQPPPATIDRTKLEALREKVRAGYDASVTKRVLLADKGLRERANWHDGAATVLLEVAGDISDILDAAPAPPTLEERVAALEDRLSTPTTRAAESREWWVNEYNDDLAIHATREQADRSAAHNRKACVRVREVTD